MLISHLGVVDLSSSGNRSEQFEAIPTLKDFVRVADLRWCNVLSTNWIRGEIVCCWKSVSKYCTRLIISSIKYFEDLVKLDFIMHAIKHKVKYSLSEPNDLKRGTFLTFRCLA